MGIRIIKDGQVVQEAPKTQLELKLEELERRIIELENKKTRKKKNEN
jgi:polyhydroxyalkanoate synthesis regulator phasin